MDNTTAQYNEALEALRHKIHEKHIETNASMKKHTSFKIGGPADILITPDSMEEVRHAYDVLRQRQIPIFLMGNGSNLLVLDGGIRGAVIKISDTYKQITREGNVVIADAGALLSTLANYALGESLGNFEWASGIPGTVGGAVFMNAGAYGGEMKDVVIAVTVLDLEGQIRKIGKEQLNFGYRTSNIQDNGWVVLSVEMALEERPVETIAALMADLNLKRTTKQPLNLPSAGSTFKRPEGYYAGKLIEDSGLRGLKYGDAMVSELHCGFVVNIGNATSHHVLTLIQTIQKIVKDLHGVDLHPEVRLVGMEGE